MTNGDFDLGVEFKTLEDEILRLAEQLSLAPEKMSGNIVPALNNAYNRYMYLADRMSLPMSRTRRVYDVYCSSQAK